ncbi:tyrosine-protein phosphatase non-receptor type 4b isoform X2 [Astyanax mexicanus]|uniref:tyrosine-protein phosphatase non-receptor type 4b isoform X2 n=1 Tax=Astyanax mexicanus TaxID=7994 RepID=UPI0020CB2955|nr:tyrosine-protein phosphatase non-receptor type 4b isoform X2 [Astyanax mexicanus]
MTARFRLPAGRSSDVGESEVARDRQSAQGVCIVLLLDNTVQAFRVNKQEQGQALLDIVFEHLQLTERDYFGLQLTDETSENQRWLDPNKPIRKQLKRVAPNNLSFRVKFFVSEPSKLQEEYTRYLYFLQLKQDILSGRLPCPQNAAALLASYAIQAELGDYSQSEHLPGYLSEFSFIPNPPEDFEKEVAKLHQQHNGLSPAQAEFNYLSAASSLDLYGVELHYARDQTTAEVYIGVMSAGISIYKNRVRVSHFPWVKIVKISFKSKQFFIQLRKESSKSRESLLGFSMMNYRACKNVWKACVEHHTFFRLERPAPQQKSFFAHYFTLGSKFRYCGRTEAQSVQYGKERGVKDRVFARSPSKPLVRRLVSGMDWETVSRNSLSDDRLETQSLPNRSPPGSPNHSIFTPDGTRVRPSSIGHLVDHVIDDSPCQAFNNHKSASSTQANSISLDSTPSPDGAVDGQPPALPPKQSRKNLVSHISQSRSELELDDPASELYDMPVVSDKSMNGAVPHDNLVLIKMKPDENGRFGFNVKGGADQRMPIIVSRVAPGTAADLCVPRLNEGDQVVLINGRDISDYTHDDVVMLIKASCENQSAELILLVRPNAIYDVDEEDEKLDLESEFHYIPESCGLDRSHSEPDGWKSSFQLLRDGLSSGSVLAQFDQLYRKRPGMSMSCARLPQNVSKNRYRDISPYDTTRVVLKGTEDYINANYINMEITGGGGVRRYIACQGPLPGTCGDFWQMVWEQSATLVVMLTTQVERGRVKCHQYWPNVSATGTYGGFQVTCISEDGNSAYLLRALTLTHLESKEERQLCQMQYMAWPDHGVPDDSTDFLNFVSLVRSKRGDSQEAVVVHCSAGIGRTGVLITMETAMCLIERSQSVYPLDIVRTMRDQRAMMIQTPSQYRFVCEAILKVYDEEMVKPLELPEPAEPPEPPEQPTCEEEEEEEEEDEEEEEEEEEED